MNFAKDFPVLKNNKNLIYFDNAATVLKPNSVIQSEMNFLLENGANSHTTDFKNAFLAGELIDNVRKKVATFLKVDNCQEIIFTSGTTESLNQIAFGLKHLLNPDDEILVTALEHASNLLPWVVINQEKKAKIQTIDLLANGLIDLEKLTEKITKKTKILAFAHGSNTLGPLNDVVKITKIARQINPEIIIVIDAAQTVAHAAIDAKKWDVDFIAFSAHKMYGPFGIGVLWGKKEQLERLTPLLYGGGMSFDINNDLKGYDLNTLPYRLEAGTNNIPGIIGLGAAIDYINQIGIEKIQDYEIKLKRYAVKQIKKMELEKTIQFYNLDNDSPLLTFNSKKWNSQDISNFLDYKYNIAVRSGAHCARLTSLVYGNGYSIRASFALYNTFDEIDILLEALQASDNFLDVIF